MSDQASRCSYCDSISTNMELPRVCDSCGAGLVGKFGVDTTLLQLAKFARQTGGVVTIALLSIDEANPHVVGVLLWREDKEIWGTHIRSDGLPLTEDDQAAIIMTEATNQAPIQHAAKEVVSNGR